MKGKGTLIVLLPLLLAIGCLGEGRRDGPPAISTGAEPTLGEVAPRRTFDVAFVLMLPASRDPDGPAVAGMVSRLEGIATALGPQFLRSTYGSGALAVDPTIHIVQDDRPIRSPDRIFGEDANGQLARVLRERFYAAHDDIYDFLAVYADAPDVPAWGGTHFEVRSLLDGLGRFDELEDRGEDFGSEGRLRGIGMVTDANALPDVYDFEASDMHLLLHELVGHSFGAHIPELSRGDTEHFERGVESPGFTVMYGRPWVQGDDPTTFEVLQDIDPETGFYPITFHPWVLYHVGLLERHEVPDRILAIDLDRRPRSRYDVEPATGFPTALVLDELIEAYGDRELLP